jgi:hypothetical protein
LSVLLTCKEWCAVGKRVFDPSERNNIAIRAAAAKGRINCVKSLLKDSRVNPASAGNYAIRTAWYLFPLPFSISSAYGHVQVVKELLKDTRVDPSAHHHFAIR